MQNRPKALLAIGIIGAASLGLWALTRRAAAGPEGIDISDMEATESGPHDGYYSVIFSVKITNTSSESKPLKLTWGSNYLGAGYEEEASRSIEIEPGKAYTWTWTYNEVFDYYRGYLTCQLFVDGGKRVGVWK